MSRLNSEVVLGKRLCPVALEGPSAMIAGRDEESVRVVRRTLEAAGYRVTVAPAGPRLLRSVRRVAGLELLVLDGTEQPWPALALAEAVRRAHPTLPVIFIADIDAEVRAEARRLDINVLLSRPIDPRQLRRAAADVAPLVPEVVPQVLH
jgi:CheY-like chemotaxis protein